MMSDVSDADVVARSLAEPEVFGQLFDRHAATILRYLARRLGRTTAEGVLGEVFRVAFEARGRFDGSRASARPWLYGIASNLLLKHRRTEARRLRALAGMASARELGVARGRDLGDEVEARRLLERVSDAVAELPEGERDALILFAWEDLGYEEVAAALGIPVGTVRSRLNRARKRIRHRTGSTGLEAGTEGSPSAERSGQ